MASRQALACRNLVRDPTKQRSVLVFGAGAIGAVAGWRLAQSPNVRVSVVCRSNYEAVKANGFRMSSMKWGAGQFVPHSVHRTPLDIANHEGPFDYVICANKVTAGVEKQYQSLRPVVGDNTTLVSFQNGIDVEAPLRRTFPRNTLISSIVYYSCRQPMQGVITQDAGIQAYFAGLALFQENGTKSSRSAASSSLEQDEAKLDDLVRLGGGELQPLDNLLTARWSKQLWNGAFNPLCAIFRQDTQRLLHHLGRGRSLVERIMTETFNVATAAGAVIDPSLPQQLIDVTMRNPPIEPSMLQDVRSNRPMEIESLSGNICRLGRKLGVDVTELSNAYQELLEMNNTLRQGGRLTQEAEPQPMPMPMAMPMSMASKMPNPRSTELDAQAAPQPMAQAA